MRLFSIRPAARTLIRFISAGVVGIWLSVARTTPYPAVAPDTANVRDATSKYSVPNALWAARADDNDGIAESRGKQTPVPNFVGPGLGWG
jgi:hypothetical protein